MLDVALADLDRARLDGGISLRRLSAASGVSLGHLSELFAGDREPSVSVLTAISRALGGHLSIRFYPSGGPQIRDRIQAPIVEELLHVAHPTWDRVVELPVTRPTRGFIDVVFDRSTDTVATEVESRLGRLEQQIRRAEEKARSLPSSDLWSRLDGDRHIHRLLVLRSTAATREIARRFEATLGAAYPARAIDLYAALTQPDRAWPGDGILWADVRGDEVRILPRPPRGVSLGR
ncbi:MAG TPA: helix-turn-helix transcriptional regulator [Candidatus Limnocylindrales bacterium]|nr:helix-turn-helix transcriptional regulator [Candidatus Limnocylindrales bacterium]